MYFMAGERARVSQQLELGQEHADPTGQLLGLQGADGGSARSRRRGPSRLWPDRDEVEEEQKDLVMVRGLVQPLLGAEGAGGDAGEGQGPGGQLLGL